MSGEQFVPGRLRQSGRKLGFGSYRFPHLLSIVWSSCLPAVSQQSTFELFSFTTEETKNSSPSVCQFELWKKKFNSSCWSLSVASRRLNYLCLCSRSGVLSSPNICCTEERWGRTTVLPKGVSWCSGMIFDCSRQRGRDSTAATTQLSERNYNSHAICPADTEAPPLVDVIGGDPLRPNPAG